MKKMMLISAFFAMLAADGAFAQISFGAWGKAGWAPLTLQGGVNDEGDETVYPGVGSGPDGMSADIGFELHGVTRGGNAGFDAKVHYNVANTKWDAGDNTANIWAKPFGSLVILRAGLYQIDDLRGTIGPLNLTMIVGDHTGDEDTIFKRVESKVFGAHLIVQPLTGLQLHASTGTNGKIDDGPGYQEALWDIYASGQYGIAYTINKIGFARFQFIGGTYGRKPSNYYLSSVDEISKFQFAFQLTAVKRFALDAGFTFPLPVEIATNNGEIIPLPSQNLKEAGGRYQPPMVIAVGASYSAGELGLNGRLESSFAGTRLAKSGAPEESLPVTLGLSLEPFLRFGRMGVLYGDISLGLRGNSKTGDTGNKDGTVDLGLGLSFCRIITRAGGELWIGLAANIPAGGEGYEGDSHRAYRAQNLKIALPVIVTFKVGETR